VEAVPFYGLLKLEKSAQFVVTYFGPGQGYGFSVEPKDRRRVDCIAWLSAANELAAFLLVCFPDAEIGTRGCGHCASGAGRRIMLSLFETIYY
jgi:hypothetical protein